MASVVKNLDSRHGNIHGRETLSVMEAPPGKDPAYLHGFTNVEQERLRHQARFAEQSVYEDIDLSGVDKLLEVGCGVGAQSEILLRRFPGISLTGIDLSESQLSAAKSNLAQLGFAEGRWELHKQDASAMSLPARSFDGAFLCWILEHANEPARVLSETRRMLRQGSIVYLTEVMNSSFFLEPYSPALWKYWMAFNDYQHELGGDPFVGAKLGNLLLSTGFRDIETNIKSWHLDNRHPIRRQEMITYWSNLLWSASEQLLEAGVVSEELVAAAKAEMQRVSTDPNAVFFYSFVQARARVY